MPTLPALGRRLLPTACLAGPAIAQFYPARPITFIVPFGPGSTSDIVARLIAGAAAARLGQPLVIENRPGAGGLIGAEALARAVPDGHTMGLGTVTSHAVAPPMAAAIPFDLRRDFIPVCLLVTAPAMLLVHRSVPANDLPGYLAHARRQGRSTFTSAGAGSITHLAGETLRARHDAPLMHVPYSLFGQALVDVLAGRVEALFYQIPALAQHIAAGTLRPLAGLSLERLALFPALPTAAETLADPGLDFTTWFGAFLPAGTAPAIVDRLSRAMLGALEDPAVRGAFPSQGLEAVGWGPTRFAAFFEGEISRWRDIVAATGMRSR